MVVHQTMGLETPLSFMTAPPDVEQIARTRFREPRNLPYRNAPPHTASIYYWWWAFLKLNPHYQKTCLNNGSGPLTKLYSDFGNIFEVSFENWWERHQRLFAEQSPIVTAGDPPPGPNEILYRIDPYKPFNQIHEEILAIHLQRHAIMPAVPPKQMSTAKYPIYTNVSANTLYKARKIWQLRQAHPEKSIYDIGVLAGLRPNLMQMPENNARRTRSALEAKAHNKRAVTVVTNNTYRYLRTAKQYITNVGFGEFPKALRR